MDATRYVSGTYVNAGFGSGLGIPAGVTYTGTLGGLPVTASGSLFYRKQDKVIHKGANGSVGVTLWNWESCQAKQESCHDRRADGVNLLASTVYDRHHGTQYRFGFGAERSVSHSKNEPPFLKLNTNLKWALNHSPDVTLSGLQPSVGTSHYFGRGWDVGVDHTFHNAVDGRRTASLAVTHWFDDPAFGLIMPTKVTLQTNHEIHVDLSVRTK